MFKKLSCGTLCDSNAAVVVITTSVFVALFYYKSIKIKQACTCERVHLSGRARRHMRLWTYVGVLVCGRVRVCVWACVWVRVWACVGVSVGVYVYGRVGVFLYVGQWACVCVYLRVPAVGRGAERVVVRGQHERVAAPHEAR